MRKLTTVLAATAFVAFAGAPMPAPVLRPPTFPSL